MSSSCALYNGWGQRPSQSEHTFLWTFKKRLEDFNYLCAFCAGQWTVTVVCLENKIKINNSVIYVRCFRYAYLFHQF